MAKTFNDFMIECAAFPYSQEHLDLMKENAELQLTCQYLSNQVYMQENSHLFGPNVQLTSGYLTESVDDYTIEALCESASSKAKSIQLKIWRGIQKILNVFRSFFSKIANKFDDVTVAAEKARERLAKVKLDDAAIGRLNQIVKNGLDKSEGFVPHDRQPFTKKLKMNYTSSSPAYTKLRANLAAALSNDISVAEAFVSKGNANMGAIPAEDIEEAMEQFMIGGKGTLSTVSKTLATSFASTKVDGIPIKVNTGDIKRTAERLEKIKAKLDKKVQKMVDEANSYSNQVGAIGTVTGAVGGAVEREGQHAEAHTESTEYFEEKAKKNKGNPNPTPTPGGNPEKKSVGEKAKEAAEKLASVSSAAASKASEMATKVNDGVKNNAGKITTAMGTATKAAGEGTTAAATAAIAATTQVSQEAYTAITVVIGATTKVYTGLNAYRTSVVNELNSYLKTLETGSSAKDDKTGEAAKTEEKKSEEQPKDEGKSEESK